jgi:hypothetical protein
MTSLTSLQQTLRRSPHTRTGCVRAWTWQCLQQQHPARRGSSSRSLSQSMMHIVSPPLLTGTHGAGRTGLDVTDETLKADERPE